MASHGKMFDGFLEALPDALVGVDPSGVIRVVNRRAESAFGYGRDDLIGAPLEMLVPGSLDQVRLVAHAEALDGHVDAVVVDDEGRVVVRLDAYTTVAVPGGIPDDVRGCLRAAFGSETST